MSPEAKFCQGTNDSVMMSNVSNLENVFIVEDDIGVRDSIAMSFEFSFPGVNITTFGRAAGVIEAVGSQIPDLITIDLGLPDENGLDLIRGIRQSYDLPIVVITGRDDDSSLSAAIELGADQYLVKPISSVAIQAHVMSLLRMKRVGRYSDLPARVIKTQYGSVDLDAGITTNHGVTEPLSETELHLLECIADGRGNIVTRRTLGRAVWGQPDVGVTLLKNAIRRLRIKIGDDDEHPVIMNHQSVGFSIVKQ